MLSIRPSIGWLTYFVLRHSPRRLWGLLGVGGVVSLFFVYESQFTLTLTFQAPGPFPPPVIIVTHPDMEYLTAWDACGVEAATKPVKINHMEKINSEGRTKPKRKPKMINQGEIQELLKRLQNPMMIHGALNASEKGSFHDEQLEVLHHLLDKHDKFAEIIYEKMMNSLPSSADSWKMRDTGKTTELDRETESDEETENVKMEWGNEKDEPRDVWVYQWKSTVFRGDKWTHFINDLPSVHLNYFDPKKGVPSTHLRSWRYRAGLATQMPWVRWVTAAFSLLWGSGGIVLPSGVILTHPLTPTVMERGEGVFLEGGKGEGISPLILGVPPQHSFVSTAMDELMSDESLMSARSPDPPLTPHAYLTPATPLLTEAMKGGCNPDMEGCDNFLMLPRGEAVGVNGLQVGSGGVGRGVGEWGGEWGGGEESGGVGRRVGRGVGRGVETGVRRGVWREVRRAVGKRVGRGVGTGVRRGVVGNCV
ncbi:hypothetical protein FHG87_012693 [Trinorchestia longiramus]|nr:hypothetical protein FHG87_012693 [Trinorchestia longiramus]